MKPIAESYEKQQQFVTDTNHDLKTPLTVFLANLDIAETDVYGIELSMAKSIAEKHKGEISAYQSHIGFKIVL